MVEAAPQVAKRIARCCLLPMGYDEVILHQGAIMPRHRKPRLHAAKDSGSATVEISSEAALFRTALAAHQSGRLADAIAGYRQILLHNKGHADALHLLGTIYFQLGNLDDAATLIFHALALREDAFFLGNLGLVLAASRRASEAEAAYRRAIHLKPDYVDAYNNLGNLLKDAMRLTEAVTAYRSALTLKPDFVLANLNLGLVLAEINQLAEAETVLRKALSLCPDLAQVHNALGDVLRRTNRYAEAESVFRQAIKLNASYLDAHIGLGLLLHEVRRLSEAEGVYRQALELAPLSCLAHNNLGTLLLEMKRFTEAEDIYLRAIELDPDFTEAHDNLGLVYKETKRASEAEAKHRHAMTLNPEYAHARWNLSCLLLSQGRYAEAWPDFEARHDSNRKEANAGLLALPYPQWQGEQLAGKSIAIWPEQGFGDYIQFVRYVPLLKKRGASHVTVVCHPPLKPLLETVDGVDAVITNFTNVPVHDYWSFPLSLPRHFGTTLDNIPNALPYLSALEERLDRWRGLIPSEGLRVGIAWKGSTAHKNDANRSLPSLSIMEPILNIQNVKPISLQKELDENEPRERGLIPSEASLGDRIEDFADTAAIVSLLDLVVCVDTAVAHVAGALGKPCWVMLPALGTDWRWLTDRTDSPWYPGTLQLFRQSRPNDWRDVIEEVALSLRGRSCHSGELSQN